MSPKTQRTFSGWKQKKYSRRGSQRHSKCDKDLTHHYWFKDEELSDKDCRWPEGAERSHQLAASKETDLSAMTIRR